jgi:hypothetical protein
VLQQVHGSNGYTLLVVALRCRFERTLTQGNRLREATLVALARSQDAEAA